MATEEQLEGVYLNRLAGGDYYYRVGQRLSILNRIVSKLAFKTQRFGDCAGATVTLTIRKVTDDSIVASKVYGLVSSVPLTLGWIEVTFETPVYINEEARTLMEWSGTSGDIDNYLQYRGTVTSVKPKECVTVYVTSYGEVADWDATYIYTYEIGIAPTVTTQATTGIRATNATGNGTIVALGSVPVTQHGHCWSISANPTTANDKTQNGAGSVGAFTSGITGLSPETLYHTRAYAASGAGTSYGADVEFTTLAVPTGFVSRVYIM